LLILIGVVFMERYPIIIGNASGIEWPDGVGPLSMMDKAHDLHMLNNLLARIREGNVGGMWQELGSCLSLHKVPVKRR